VAVPPLTLDTEIQKKRFHEAEIRKQMRWKRRGDRKKPDRGPWQLVGNLDRRER